MVSNGLLVIRIYLNLSVLDTLRKGLNFVCSSWESATLFVGLIDTRDLRSMASILML